MKNKTKPRSNQEAFNRVWRHFILEDNEQCGSRTIGCSYRGARGQACAVGCMMPYKMAKKADNDGRDCATDIETIINRLPSAEKWFSAVDLHFLESLQCAHDRDGFNDDKENCLREVATSFGLTVPKH